MRIVQIGGYPPPYGGVAVHIKRLHERLRAQGVDSIVLDLSMRSAGAEGVLPMDWKAACRHLTTLPPSIVHVHSFVPGFTPDIFFMPRRHRIILSLHNERFPEELNEVGIVKKHLALLFLRRLDCIVVSSPRCLELARRLFSAAARIEVIPAYIPVSAAPALLHPGLVALRSRYRFLLASNASKLFFYNGQDMYGIDLLVELLRELVDRHRLDAALALLLALEGHLPYLEEIKAKIRDAALGDRFCIVTEQLPESTALWSVSDVVIRATNTDGDSLTVREALSWGVPVVASDCVSRPNGAILFRSRDVGDLVDKVRSVLLRPAANRSQHGASPATDHGDDLIRLYRELGRGIAR
jgi:glycosyltransferase involved in cell wall biosynthesis